MIRIVLLLLQIAILSFAKNAIAADRWADERKIFLAAEAALQKGDYQRFDQLIKGLVDYPLYPYLRYRAVMRNPGNITMTEHFLREHRNTRYATAVRNRYLDYLARKGDWTRYVKYYQVTRDAEQQCLYYQGLLTLGEQARAFGGAKTLWLVGESQPKACDPLFSAWQRTKSFTSSVVWQRFELSMRNKNTKLAKYLIRFLPTDEKWIAEKWLKVHQSPALVGHFELNKAPIDLEGKIFIDGIDRLASSDPKQALAIWRGRHQQFSIEPIDRVRIDKRLAMAHVFRRDDGAYALLSAIGDDVADVEVKEWRLRSALKIGNWQGVLDSFSRLDELDQEKPSWLYWKARALEVLGKQKAADEIYRNVAKDRSFLGFMAADRLGIDYSYNHHAVNVSDEAISLLASTQPFQAVDEFRRLERTYDARGQWWHAISQLTPTQLLVAAKMAQQLDWDQIAIFTISRAEYWDDLELRFPLGFQRQVKHYANQNEIAPEVILGVIRQESAFYPTARSPAGARGLMQIMPATGKQIAHTLKVQWGGVNALYEPDTNIRYGSSYLKGLLNRFGGNLALATAAYNAGPHRVDRWMPDAGFMPTDIWAELIPFRETRRYVASVLAYTIIYRHRLGLDQSRISNYVGEVKGKAAQLSLRSLNSAINSGG